MQPGNNYRGGASTLTDGLADDQITQAKVDANTPPAPVVLGDMLTVWRKVWLELDSMANGTDINYSGAIDAIFDNDPHPLDGKFEYDVDDINDDGRFEGGVALVPSTARVYTLIDNMDATGDDYYITDGLIVGNDLGQTANVVDDDTAILPQIPDANQTVLNDKYGNCYIVFTENTATRDNNNVFVATLPYDDNVVANKGLENADLTPAANFWLAVVVTCYQSHHDTSGSTATTKDGDPDPRYHYHPSIPFEKTGDQGFPLARVSEVAVPGGANRNVVVLFVETMEDYLRQVQDGQWGATPPHTLPFMEPRVIAHEIGHFLGLTHTGAAGTIMDTWSGADRDFNAQQIDDIRTSTYLGQ